jgi:hybrid polyketide synthase/nonribosomal peptide synthetase ACE1
LLDRAANELGIDSLIAVDLRTWFLKELEVDMPVLKILGGASIREMLEFTIEKLPESLVPNLNGEARIVEEQEASAAPAATEEIVIHVEPAAESSVSSSPSTTSEEFVKVESTPSATTASSVISMSDSFVDTKPSNSKMSRVQDLSFGQSRFWTLMSLLEDSTALNIAALVKMSGPLRVNDLEKAVRLVGQRHEALRTCFYTDESGNAKQGILEQGTLSLEQKPLREEDVKKEFQAMRTYQFNLEQGEVMRVILSSQSSTLHHIIIAYHHIALDGVSLEIFLSDMQKTYNGQSLSSNVLQYPDFAARQQSEIRTGKAASELTYWKKQFPDFPAPLPLLPFSATRVRKTLNSYDFHSVDFRVDGALTSRIKLACKKHKATPFHFYFAAYQTLLFRLLNVDDVCIGMADANRLEHDAMTSIGNYLNLLPVRLQAKPVQSFVDAMQQVRTRTYGALGNSKIPFDVLLEELKVERSPLYGPLFQSFINYRQGVQEKRMFGDARAEGQEYLIAKTAYDMSLDIIDNPGGHATVSFMVQRSLYSEHDAERLMACYVRLLEAFSKKPTATLAQPSLYSQEQLDHALKRGRGPAIENKGPATLVHAVDQIAHNHAERPALKDSTGKHLTYRQMAARVNAIASALLSKDLGGEKRVAVFQEPTVDWACSMLAIMRTGSTYVPLDPRLSIERLKAIGKDCAPAGILINETTASDVPKLELGQSQVINVSKIAEQHQAPTKIAAQPNSPACILYTSGSTGLPKGIVLRHAGLANEIADSADKFSLTTNDKVLQQSALSFDMSLWQTFNALANGAMLYVMAQKDRVDPNIISSYIKSEGITGTWGTPSEYMMWLRDGDVNALQSSAWRVAVSGGEQVTQTHLDEFASLNKAGLSFWNGYGPTEVTIVSSTIELPYASGKAADSDRNPVGFTTRNCSVYVVDEHLQLLPVGYAGEILVGGPGVALGYLGNDALTKEKFLPDTFASSEQVSNGWMTMYRTGDRGRFRADGALIVEGRIEGDTEVKLRGLRIDLQDVEKAILRTANGTILNVVVTVRGEPQYLAAHLQFTHSFPVEQRGAFWTKTVSSLPLPKYMRPSIAVAVDNFPLTDHGKIDTQAVARMQLDETPLNGSGSGATLSENQATLRSLWVDILPSGQSVKDDINASTDFFQVGGNSGLLVRLQRGIRNAFDVVVPLMQLFEGSTLDSMVSLVEGFETQKTIDWDAEIAIDAAAIRSQTSSLVSSAPAKKAGEGKTVVLTGSTGNLGSAILSQLLADPSVSSIHCVAVRSNPTNADLFSQPQVTIHEGDLTAPLLGLSTSTFSTLATQADLIIHAGAARSFWDYYHTLRTTNVSSVREIVSLAAQRKVPIHFLSSGGVADLGNTTPSSDGKNGYVASKWAAEQLLQNASSQLDIPIVIHRTAGVEANASANQTVKEQVLRDFVAFAEKLRAVPDENLGWKGNMEVLPLSELSEAIAKSATTSSTEKVQFSNHSAVVKLSADEISAYAKQSLGDGEAGFEHLPAIEWVGKAKKAGWQWVFGKMDLVVEGVDGLNLHR